MSLSRIYQVKEPTPLWEEEETLGKGKEEEVPSEREEIVIGDKKNQEFNNLINILNYLAKG